MNKSSKIPCQTCRARHYKCDRILPVCGQCHDSGRTCVPAFNVRFRRHKVSEAADKGLHGKGKLTFSDNQKWVETPKNLSFVDEFAQAAEVGEPSRRSDTNLSDCGRSSSLAPTTEEVGNRRTETIKEFNYSQGFITTHSASCTPEQPTSDEPILDNLSDIDQTLSLTWTPYNSIDKANTPSHLPVIEMTAEYTQLLHYFKAAIGWPWFDITDPGFTMKALRLAPMSPLLLYSILATACIHKSRHESGRDNAYELGMQANSLHEKCVSILLPMIQQKDLITDSAFLACNTILRFYEEISAPAHGRDDARHLLGGSASVAEFQNQELAFDGLSKAAFWVHLRQDTVVAIINHRVPNMNLDFPDLVHSFDAEDGYTWAKRATWIHAEVVEFCFGSDMNSPRRFRYIAGKLDEWYQWKSDIFAPAYYQSADPAIGRPFPKICFTLDIGALGLSYYFFSMLLMAIYDPNVPRIGPECLEGQRRTKSRVIYYLRLLCGLAWSNPVPPARATCSLAISQCGGWVSDMGEQDALINTLKMIETIDLWPTLSSQEALQRQWERDKQN